MLVIVAPLRRGRTIARHGTPGASAPHPSEADVATHGDPHREPAHAAEWGRYFDVGVAAVVLQPTSDEPELGGFIRQAGEVAREIAS